MKPVLRSVFLPAALLASATLLSAHPGHEGHELTWDFDHLAAHPAATLGWVAIFALAVWLLVRLVKSARDANHTLRGSQRSRGK
jgi:hypothetical protein